MQKITKYENMAMLELPEDERGILEERFAAIAGSFNELDRYDTNGTEPLVTVLDLGNIMREDVPVKFMPRSELLANAPEQHDGFFRVPGTLD